MSILTSGYASAKNLVLTIPTPTVSNTVTINFGDNCNQDIDYNLFEKEGTSDNRQTLTVSAVVVVYEDKDNRVISAEQTLKRVQVEMRKKGLGGSSGRDFCWRADSSLKALFPEGSKLHKQLITYIAHNL